MLDEAARRTMPQTYSKLLNSFDVEGVVNLFTEDIIFEDPVGRPPLVGREALRTHLSWATMANVHEEPGRSVTSMDGRFIVTPVTVTITLLNETVLRIISIVELDKDGRGKHVQAYWGLTDMTTRSHASAALSSPQDQL